MPNKELLVHNDKPLATWDPLREFKSLTGISNLFEDFFTGLPAMSLAGTWTPRVNIKETDKEYVISAALPGIKKEDVKVNLQDGVLVISGETKEEKEDKGKDYLRQEMRYGSFRRSFALPSGIHPENLKASCKDGILTVIVPKPFEVKTRGINIKVD